MKKRIVENKKLQTIFMVLLCAIILSGCADRVIVPNLDPSQTYGFWSGAWHGMTVEIAFIGSLFSDDIAIYAVNNNGAWYDFGYIGGFWVFWYALKLFVAILFS